ncbi:VOC family protein [Sorangium atrum]|uniref:VOC family protein n=1 Tax=Sorangium atrum TaxID=2995308 RepID=A0ABT5BUA9_9BACT|nr:VOC family protein [Sorangium aterium]
MPAKKTPNQIDFIEFPARDVAALQRAKVFFAETFGWSFEHWGDDYVDIKGSGLGSGINADPEHRPSKPLVVIYVQDLEETRRKVTAAGGKLTRDIFSFPGGRRFHFKDPSGNEMAAWSDQ